MTKVRKNYHVSKKLRFAYARYAYRMIKADVHEYENTTWKQASARKAFEQAYDLEDRIASHFYLLLNGHVCGLLSFGVYNMLSDMHFKYRDILCDYINDLAADFH